MATPLGQCTVRSPQMLPLALLLVASCFFTGSCTRRQLHYNFSMEQQALTESKLTKRGLDTGNDEVSDVARRSRSFHSHIVPAAGVWDGGDSQSTPAALKALAEAKVAHKPINFTQHPDARAQMPSAVSSATTFEGYEDDLGPMLNGSQAMHFLHRPFTDGERARMEALQSLEAQESKRQPSDTFFGRIFDTLYDVSGGTGATISGSGNTVLDKVLLRRMRYQDKVVMLLLLMSYLGALFFSLMLSYRQAHNDFSVSYYADPRSFSLIMDGHDTNRFISVFARPPKDVHLHVCGLMPLEPMPDFLSESAVEWLGHRYRVDFAFSLDLSPWLVPEPLTPSESEATAVPLPRDLVEEGSDVTGLWSEDIVNLHDYLSNNTNDLAQVEVRKFVEWKGWEELAANIKTQMRQAGYMGVVDVRHSKQEHMMVYKNRHWANFLHSRTTKVLCALSIFGWMIYQPYMWLRQRVTVLRCKYRVDCPIDNYWALIQDKLSPQGFTANPSSQGAFGPPDSFRSPDGIRRENRL